MFDPITDMRVLVLSLPSKGLRNIAFQKCDVNCDFNNPNASQLMTQPQAVTVAQKAAGFEH